MYQQTHADISWREYNKYVVWKQMARTYLLYYPLVKVLYMCPDTYRGQGLEWLKRQELVT